jgi:hypothetical protein
MLRTLFPQAVFLPKQRSIRAKVKVQSRTLHSPILALLDSGATDNFISPEVIEHFSIPTRALPTPRTIRNVDGTKNSIGKVTQLAQMTLHHNNNKPHLHNFYVVDLGEDEMLLGMPFFAAVNPKVNWTQGTFNGKVVASTTDSHLWTPNRDHKVWKPFMIPNDPSLRIDRTTKSTQLAVQNVDKTVRTWQQQVPREYHHYGKVFSDEAAQRFPKSRPWDHAIDLKSNAPSLLNCDTYRLPEGHQELLDQFLDEHLKKGYIRRSKSPYASPFFFIGKKDAKKRPVQDYRELNKVTIPNTYPLPLIATLIDQLVKKRWFTKFDIRWGYNNVRIKDGDQWKAAFKTNRGLFEPMVMYFGLTNSPATFQTMMDEIFKEEIAKGDVTIYMDDILIATEGDLQRHKQEVAHVLKKLQDNDLFLKPEKCSFHKREVDYLGAIVGEGKVKMDPVKVNALAEWPTPTSVKDIRSFLGFGNYYKGFIDSYSAIARPLHELTKKLVPWHWDDKRQNAFDVLKQMFTSYPVLRNPDPDKRYIVDTDASAYAVGATISQDFPDGRHPIAFFSKSLLPAERNYDIYDRELLAIIYAVKAFRHLLLGARHQFLIRSDHKNLTYFKKAHLLSARQARWHEHLQDYNFTLEHFPGKSNTIADLLSRRKDFEGGVKSHEVTMLPESLFNSPNSSTSSVDLKINKAYLEDKLETRREILHKFHDTPVGGHPGISNTWDLINRRYEGPRLRQFVEQYVKGCAKCQESKAITHLKRAPLYHFNTQVEHGPFQYVSMDLITDLPRSDGYDAILTIVDQGCSKAAKFLPCNKTIDGQGIAQLYFRHLFPWFGIPKRIISDRDPRFTSHFSKAVCKATGIEQNISTAFHPRTDGQTEVMNKWVETYLREFVNGRQNNWSSLLPVAEFAHNSWKHEHTRHTPHELITGMNPTAFLDVPEDSVPAAQERLKILEKSRSIAQKALQKRIKPLNVPRSFVPGNKVWLNAHNLRTRNPSRKLSPKRYGPFEILKQVSPVTYRIKLPPSMKIHNVFHIDLLIPYNETEAYGETFSQPPPELIDGEEEFEVEEIIAHRIKYRKKQYLVKWKGYSASEDSWVYEKDLNAPELLDVTPFLFTWYAFTYSLLVLIFRPHLYLPDRYLPLTGLTRGYRDLDT